jgi:hypothetical protein
VVPESPTAQDSPAKEQQPEDHDIKDKTNEEHPPLSDTKAEKMYRDADEVELNLRSSPVDFGLCWSTWASPPLPGIGSRKSRVQGE